MGMLNQFVKTRSRAAGGPPGEDGEPGHSGEVKDIEGRAATGDGGLGD
jgi:hypothetical protein